MKVYFVRHGQSEGNVRRYHQDKLTQLTEHGRNQAELVAQRCKKIDFDVILASDYVRAHDTTKAIAKASSMDVEVCELLRETRSPSFFQGKHHKSHAIIEIKNIILSNFSNPDWRHSDEENFYDMFQRAKQCIEFLQQRTEKNITCVAHGNNQNDCSHYDF